ncbi:hypothetical protein DCS_05112 [Drechmeria coniospora]|uniref:Uncharacterized protein n=1 Tax=Drechmeria coniospora TaxID=98403 RepID=A0A151GLX1_DRECN|nr:hypothetical protein DCS_05112 [Drechmeria coniospora]KYK58099.1 hypothetical protein DCS_05112 [Drechmeria coniospora]
MTLPRACSGLLRHRVRLLARAPAPLHRRRAGTLQNDLGGPRAQQPRSQNIGEPEKMKRNWYLTRFLFPFPFLVPLPFPFADGRRKRVPVGGAALLVVAAYAYLTGSSPSPKVVTPTKETMGDKVSSTNSEEAGAPSQAGEETNGSLAKRLEDTESDALAKLSGRKKSEYGSFRAD